MGDSSRSRITITLGRNSQVVKRDISVSSGSYSDSRPMSGMKRSARDRIGDNGDSFSWHGSQVSSSKRQRGESMQSSNYNGFDDGMIRKDDLRLKLLRKNAFRQARSDGSKKHVDLRVKVSRPAHSIVINPDLRHHLPVPENMRVVHQARSDDSKKHVDLHEKVSKPAHSVEINTNLRHYLPVPGNLRVLRQTHPSRSAENVSRLESMKSSCSHWTLDHISKRPSDQFLNTSRGISSLRNVDDLPRRQFHGTYDDGRSVRYVNKYLPDNARSLGTVSTSVAAHSSMSAMPSKAAKPVAPRYVEQLPTPPSTVAPKSSYVGDGPQTPQTIDGLLHSLGLGKYVITFKAEEVDMTALKQMGEKDLKELGIPMGPRKKILLAVTPHTKRQS